MPDLAFAHDPKVAVLQDNYSVGITFELIDISPLLLYFLGDPSAVLWYQMSNLYRPLWFMAADDD